ncbi:MAG: hypothetical protein CME70_01335 [Halobacteriovorax sp.]|nr:hypothetical protein [Halobacteriovorax sp.]
MRIHSIEIENITSLKGKHIVDLREGLQGEELFAITGSTGAGKSSLLSAISLALYGKTYKGSLASNDFVTTGTPYASVTLDFTLAGKNYQAKWSIKVLKKNGEPIKNPKPQRELICEGISLEQVSITDILGLDFDQFCKTIILNQGEFAKFLHSSFRERKDIIEKLYRTGELSVISKNLKEKAKNEEANLKLLSLSFEKALPYSDEEIAKITSDLEVKLSNLEIHESLTELLEPSFEAIKLLHSKLKEENEYHKKVSESEENLKSLIDIWNQLKQSLNTSNLSYEKISKSNKIEMPKLREAISIKSNLENSKKSLINLNEESSKSNTKLLEVKNELKTRLESKELFSEKLDKIKKQFALKDLFLTKTKNEIFVFKEDIIKLKSNLAEQDRYLGQKEILEDQINTAKKSATEKAEKLKGFIKELEFEPKNLEEKLLDLRRSREAMLSLWSKFEGHSDKLSDHFKEAHTIKSENLSINNELKLDKSNLLLLLEKEKNNKLTLAIKECHEVAKESGHCPVCLSEDLTNLQSPTAQENIELNSIETAKTKVSASEFRVLHNNERIKKLEEKISNLQNQLAKSKKVIFKEFKTDLDWKTSDEVSQGLKILKEVFNNRLSEELSTIENLTELKKKIDLVTNESKRAEENLSLLKENEHKLTNSITKIQSLIDLFINNWKNLIPKGTEAKEVIKNFDNDMEKFTEQIQLEQKISSNEESIASLKKQEIELQERLSQLNSELKKTQQDISINTENLKAICGDHDPIVRLESLEREEKAAGLKYSEAKDNFNKNEKKKANEEQSLRIFREQILELQNLQKTYVKKLIENFELLANFEGKIPDTYPLYTECHDLIKESHKWPELSYEKSLKGLLPILEARLESTWCSLMEKIKEVSLDLKTSVHTNKKMIEDYNAKVKDRAGLEKELNDAKKSLQIKNRLLEVFGKDEFRSYALGLLEEELVLGANQELNELCDGRYQLKLLPGKGSQMEFFALDLWRESTLRKINTLSGGETFLVSLAMALALAELTRGQNEIDSFFIDEGFGHLDSDSIDDVLEVLMNIQNRGKQIGIISHVKSLTDRIPVNLTLQKSSLGESTTEFRYN